MTELDQATVAPDADPAVSDKPPAEERAPSPEPSRPARIIVNPKVFRDKRDGLCVAYNEAYRVIMEMNGFDPQAEPTDEQRRFFADTAYADDERMLRRTILARICTFDDSVKNPTDEQLDEAVEFLDTVMEIGAPQSEEEQSVVQRTRDILAKTREAPRPEEAPAGEPPADEGAPPVAAIGGGWTRDENGRLPGSNWTRGADGKIGSKAGVDVTANVNASEPVEEPFTDPADEIEGGPEDGRVDKGVMDAGHTQTDEEGDGGEGAAVAPTAAPVAAEPAGGPKWGRGADGKLPGSNWTRDESGRLPGPNWTRDENGRLVHSDAKGGSAKGGSKTLDSYATDEGYVVTAEAAERANLDTAKFVKRGDGKFLVPLEVLKETGVSYNAGDMLKTDYGSGAEAEAATAEAIESRISRYSNPEDIRAAGITDPESVPIVREGRPTWTPDMKSASETNGTPLVKRWHGEDFVLTNGTMPGQSILFRANRVANSPGLATEARRLLNRETGRDIGDEANGRVVTISAVANPGTPGWYAYSPQYRPSAIGNVKAWLRANGTVPAEGDDIAGIIADAAAKRSSMTKGKLDRAGRDLLEQVGRAVARERKGGKLPQRDREMLQEVRDAGLWRQLVSSWQPSRRPVV